MLGNDQEKLMFLNWESNHISDVAAGHFGYELTGHVITLRPITLRQSLDYFGRQVLMYELIMKSFSP